MTNSARASAQRRRAAVGVPAALALALPMFVLTQVEAGQPASASTSARCTPDRGVPDSGNARRSSGGSREAVARRAAARWFPSDQLDVATAVAGAESSYNDTAVNPAAGGNYGLWQINAVHAKLLRGRDWRDPATNAWMAYQVWDAARGGRGDGKGSWTPWSTFNSGSYTAFLRRGAKPLPPGDEAAAPGDCPAELGLRVGTWNAQRLNSKANVAAGARDLSDRADVFGLQEVGDPGARAAAARGASGFTMSDEHTAVPIFYRTSLYTLLDSGRRLAFDQGQRVERTDSDPKTRSGPKWVTWVHLKDNASGADFYVVNTHMLVGAQNSVHARKSHPRRVALYRRQLATLTTLADSFRAQGADVYVTCDCNVNYSPNVAPVVTMGQHGLDASWQTLDSRATHGRRAIDYVWSTATPNGQMTGQRHGSDHALLAVTFESSTSAQIVGDRRQRVRQTRTVTDPGTGQTYAVSIPTGARGVAIEAALDQVGDRWRWGAHGPDAWDCSGLTTAAWRRAGVRIPAQSDAQRRTLRRVRAADARPGDIFWRKGYVGIYLGTRGHDQMVVGSLRTSGAVIIHPWDDATPVVLRPTKR